MNATPPVLGRDPLAHIANAGGPMSRTRKERVQCSLLGQDAGWIRCPRVIRLGLDFGDRDPLDILRGLLREEGALTAEDLRPRFPLPDRALICRPLANDAARLSVTTRTRPRCCARRCCSACAPCTASTPSARCCGPGPA
jgi:hypothetical protein